MIDLIKLRKKLKKKKPNFIRQEAYKRKRLSKLKWRAPKGMHSKMRRKLKSRRKQPSIGYSSPKAIRGFTREGFKPILVKTSKDLEKIKDEIIILSKSLGLKKKLLLLEKIKQLKLKVANIKDINKFIKQAKENLEAKKVKSKKKQKEKEADKKEKPKEKKEETLKEKEKKKKEEKRKILEKK